MRFLHRHIKLITVGVLCAGLGASASAVAVAGASTPASCSALHAGLRPRALIRRTVSAQLIVATRNGFATVNITRGQVKAVSGHQLTLVEGTRRATYKTVTITLPAQTRVRDNHQKATLSQVSPGQRALVVRGPHRALVIAHTPNRG
jgi:kynureninase